MKAELFDMIGIPVDYVLFGMIGLVLILFVLLIVTMAKLSKMKKSYNTFMVGNNGRSLEESFTNRFGVLESHSDAINDIYIKLRELDKNLLISYQKIGFVKYDAFKESGGKMSFILVLLNRENSGIMLNCMHSNTEGCYTYAKRIEKGLCKISLSREETIALNQALGIKDKEADKKTDNGGHDVV